MRTCSAHLYVTCSVTRRSPMSMVGYMDSEGMNRASAMNLHPSRCYCQPTCCLMPEPAQHCHRASHCDEMILEMDGIVRAVRNTGV